MTEEAEALARKQGWTPQDEWHGPPEKWRDAEAFLAVGEKSAPILSAQLKKEREDADNRLQAMQNQIDQLKAGSVKLHQADAASKDRLRQERDSAIAQLNEQRAQGITEGDGTKVLQAERQIAAIEAQAQPDTQVQDSESDWKERGVKFAKDNPWYVQNSGEYDEERRIYADGLNGVITSELPHLSTDAAGFFQELERRVEKRFQETNDERDRASNVEGSGGNKPPEDSSESFDGLPEAAKQGYETMKFHMPGLTQEDYFKNYQ